MVSAIVSGGKKRIEIDERQTPWRSIYLATVLLTFTGIQMSVYYMSTYPYLTQADPDAGINDFGYVIASVSLGCLMSNPIFGFWNQMTMSTKNPVMFGFSLAGIGNLMYGLLPMFPGYVRELMLFSRFLTGFGSGTLCVLRGFTAVASVPKDRIAAVAIASAGFNVGLSIGPIIQIFFMPFGAVGTSIGPIVINMYTTAAFFMMVACILCILSMHLWFVEDYAGIYSDEERKADPFLIIPKYDVIALAICFYLWFILCGVATTLEGISAPLTIVLYNWTNPESIFYNGILMTLSGLASAIANTVIAKTRIGKIDGRLQMIFGASMFSLHMILNYPWEFYGGPLDRVPLVNGTENLDLFGGCSSVYSWCEETSRVPMWLYIFSFVFAIGVAFPFIAAPMNTAFSEILGPRKQGMMQGFLAFVGSLSQCLTPVIITQLFDVSGFRFIMIYQLVFCLLGVLLVILFYRRIIPLKMQPSTGETSKYKRGHFTRF